LGEQVKLSAARRLEFSQLKLPGNWRSLLEDPVEVDGKEVTDHEMVPVEETGDVRHPLVRRTGGKYEIILGLKRAVAAARAKHKGLDFQLLDCTDQQAELLRAADRGNETMQDVARQLIRVLVTRAERLEPPRHGRLQTPGRPRTVRTLTREMLADELGVTTDALRKAEYRARVKAGERYPAIYDYRITQPTEWIAYTNDVRVACIEALEHMNVARRALEAVEHYGVERVNAVLLQVRHAGQRLVDHRPRQLCPYCKNVAGLVEQCGQCIREGWVGQLNETLIDHRLLGDEPLYVMREGAPVLLEGVTQRPVQRDEPANDEVPEESGVHATVEADDIAEWF
jgi:hypothetical protein